MGARLFVNAKYFDEQREASWYLAGIHAACYHTGREGTSYILRSNQLDLVELVKRELGAEHKISSPKRTDGASSHWLEIKDCVEIIHILEANYGVPPQKEGRVFPNIHYKQYIPHFVRGFIDAKARISLIDDKRTRLRIDFDQGFLEGLHAKITGSTKVESKGPKKGRVVYGHKDAIKIYRWVYKDWETIEKGGLCLPRKKALFKTEYKADKSETKATRAAKERLETAIRKVGEGKTPEEAAREAGYGSRRAFLNALRREGRSITTLAGGKAK